MQRQEIQPIALELPDGTAASSETAFILPVQSGLDLTNYLSLFAMGLVTRNLQRWMIVDLLGKICDGGYVAIVPKGKSLIQ